jgi:hypothetical protein
MEYDLIKLKDNITEMQFDGAFPLKEFWMWALNLKADDPLFSSDVDMSISLTLLPGSNVRICMSEMAKAIIYSVQTENDLPK